MPKPRKNAWTQKEIDELTRRYVHEDAGRIARDLGRGRAGVATKANEIGLRKPNRRPWTEEELEQVRSRYPTEQAHLIGKDLGRHESAVYFQANKMGVHKAPGEASRMAREQSRKVRSDSWTEEQIAEVTRRYPHERTVDIARDIGRTYAATNSRAAKLGLVKTEAYMAEQLARFSEGGKKHRMKKGATPPNKGKKMPPGWGPGRMKSTQFKPGHKCGTEVPVGTIRPCMKHGLLEYYKRKMCMDCRGGKQWMSVQRYIWMMANGPIPPGHVIRIDGWDTDNPEPPEAITLDRLECLTTKQNMVMNSIHRFPKQVVDAVMQAGRLQREINKQRGRHGKGRKAERK